MDNIRTPPSNDKYRDGWDRIFGKKKEERCECEACKENRRRAKKGLPPTHETGGLICPTPTNRR